MSSKRRLRRRSCTGKKKYATAQEAKYVAYKMRQEGHCYYGEYKCKFCKWYHVGRKDKRQMQGMHAALRARK